MNEFRNNDIEDIKPQRIESYKSIVPKEELSVKELNDSVKEEFNKASDTTSNINDFKQETHKQDFVDNTESSKEEKNIDPSHNECLTSSKERIEQASYSNGTWEGDVGNSVFHPDDKEAQKALDDFKQDGINYNDGEPDFSKVSVATVEIDHMSPERTGPGHNFNQADQKCAEKWNAEQRDGRTDWKATDVKNWRQDNRFSWHERLDRKTMDMVQRDIHNECKHMGGVAECKRLESAGGVGGGFDE